MSNPLDLDIETFKKKNVHDTNQTNHTSELEAINRAIKIGVEEKIEKILVVSDSMAMYDYIINKV